MKLKKFRTKKLVLYLFLVALFIFTLTRINPREILSSFLLIPTWVVIILIVSQICTLLLVNAQWHQVVRGCGIGLSFRKLLNINAQGAIIDAITPGVKIGGEVTRAMRISSSSGCKIEESAAIVAVHKLFSLSAFFLINLFAVSYIITRETVNISLWLQVIIYVIIVLLLIIFLALIFAPSKVSSYFAKRESRAISMGKTIKTSKFKVFFKSMLYDLGQIKSKGFFRVSLLFLSLFIWMLYPLKLLLITIHFIPDVSPVFVGASTFVAYLVAMIPIFPGGLGGFEGTLTGLLIGVGFTAAAAFSSAIIFRFFTFWFVMLISLIYAGIDRLVQRIRN